MFISIMIEIVMRPRWRYMALGPVPEEDAEPDGHDPRVPPREGGI